MLYFTSDTHFGGDANIIIRRENRPFSNPLDYINEQVRIFNDQASHNDTIYHLGDYCNYSKDERDWRTGLESVIHINADVILIVGNNEERVIEYEFNGDFNSFKNYCLSLGFKNVHRDLIINIDSDTFYLNHCPRYHRKEYINLFGHVHRATGLLKPFGFNVGVDVNNFKLFSKDDIYRLLECKKQYWDKDLDILC